jgi:hypothetical protein
MLFKIAVSGSANISFTYSGSFKENITGRQTHLR